MKLLTVSVPELEHLPPGDREEILKRCMTSEQMRHYNAIAPVVCGVLPVASGFGFLFAALFLWKWSFLPAFLAFFAITVVMVIIALGAKLALQVWVIRRLAAAEVGK